MKREYRAPLLEDIPQEPPLNAFELVDVLQAARELLGAHFERGVLPVAVRRHRDIVLEEIALMEGLLLEMRDAVSGHGGLGGAASTERSSRG